MYGDGMHQRRVIRLELFLNIVIREEDVGRGCLDCCVAFSRRFFFGKATSGAN